MHDASIGPLDTIDRGTQKICCGVKLLRIIGVDQLKLPDVRLNSLKFAGDCAGIDSRCRADQHQPTIETLTNSAKMRSKGTGAYQGGPPALQALGYLSLHPPENIAQYVIEDVGPYRGDRSRLSQLCPSVSRAER